MTTDEVLVHALAECEKSEKEYMEYLDQCEKEARKWKNEGDMYGWNFHQGLRGGAVWSNLIFYRIRRTLLEMREQEKRASGQALLDKEAHNAQFYDKH